MNSETNQKLYYGWIVVAVSFVTMAITSPAWFSFSLFYPPILEEFGWTRAATSSVYSLNLLVSGALSPVIGLLIDRYGPRIVMPLGAASLSFYLLERPFLRLKDRMRFVNNHAASRAASVAAVAESIQ